MDLRMSSPKYEDMDQSEGRKVFDVKKSAQKIAEKTQRALHNPLTHLVHQPRDEKLMEEDLFGVSRNTNNAENGGLNYAFSKSPKTNYKNQHERSMSAVEYNGARKPPQETHIKRNTTQRQTMPHGPHNVASSKPSPPQAEFIVREKRSNAYVPPFEMYTGSINDGHSFHSMTAGYDTSLNVGTTKTKNKGDELSFHDIVYKVTTKKYIWSKPVKKTVLDNISGIMLPGVNAIMGPTGSGKSSILDVLAGRKNPQYLEGKVLINGLPQPKNFKCMSGYVVQDDIIMGTLTVKENLMFSAALRLSMKTSKKERMEKVESIIDQLGLTAVANSKIGTELIRGVSGGERKRCNIGMELITDPAILFLDEPTTGLDAFTAASVIKTLQKLSRRKKTIVLSIHQPKYSIYKLFDRYTLMAKGKILYHGEAGSYPLKYFDDIGYIIEAHNNPADFFMDIIHGEVKNVNDIVATKNLESSGEYSDVNDFDRRKSEVMGKNEIISRLSSGWLNSQQNKELTTLLGQCDYAPYDPLDTMVSGQDVRVHYSTSWFNQMKWVCWRTGLNLLRNPQTSVILMGVYLFFALSMGTVYYHLTTEHNRGYQDRYGLFFFTALQVIFVNLGAIEIFIKERPIFIHENTSGYYRVSSYFFAKLLCDMVPIKVFPAVVFLPITYFMAQLRLDAGAFFFYELILLLTTSAGCSIAFFVSSSFSVFGLANVVTPIIYVFMMFFSGFFVAIESIFGWLNWCRYLSAFRYALAGLSVNELKDVRYCSNMTCMTGNDFLTQNSILYASSWDLWSNVLGLFILTLVFLALCYIQLRRMNKYK